MIEVNIHRTNPDAPANGFDLGVIEFAFDSAAKIPFFWSGNQLCMIYISISDLIDGLIGLAKNGKRY